jgi:hypothetical protein
MTNRVVCGDRTLANEAYNSMPQPGLMAGGVGVQFPLPRTRTRSVDPGIRGKFFFLGDEKPYLRARVEEA